MGYGTCNYRRELSSAPLELAVLGRAREGDDVADVGHAGGEQDQALEAEAEAGVLGGAVLAQLEVPPVVLDLEAEALHARLEHVVPLLALTAADDLPELRHQDVHRAHRLAVVVEP